MSAVGISDRRQPPVDVRCQVYRRDRVVIEYRGTEAALIEAGLATRDTFAMYDGPRRRYDPAGRHFQMARTFRPDSTGVPSLCIRMRFSTTLEGVGDFWGGTRALEEAIAAARKWAAERERARAEMLRPRLRLVVDNTRR